MASMIQDAGRYVIVELETDDGLVGLGEATVMPTWGGDHGVYYGETPGTTVSVIFELLYPALRGLNPTEVERAHVAMNRAVKGYPYAKAALDIALHDLIGKAYNVPVYQLLGGRFHDRITLAHSIGMMSIEAAVAEARAVIDEGISTIKLKIGLDYTHDAEVVREVRAAIGHEVAICLDANQAYPTPKTAVRELRRLEEYGLLLVEQPVQGLGEMAQVRRAIDTPVMADESAWTARDILQIADLGAADAISIYTTKPGGLFRARQALAVAEAAGLPCNVNGSGELGVGNAANLHLSASAAIIELPCVYPVSAPGESLPTQTAGRHYLDDVISRPFEYQNGALGVPSGPGLGIELDREKLERYEVRQ